MLDQLNNKKPASHEEGEKGKEKEKKIVGFKFLPLPSIWEDAALSLWESNLFASIPTLTSAEELRAVVPDYTPG